MERGAVINTNSDIEVMIDRVGLASLFFYCSSFICICRPCSCTGAGVSCSLVAGIARARGIAALKPRSLFCCLSSGGPTPLQAGSSSASASASDPRTEAPSSRFSRLSYKR